MNGAEMVAHIDNVSHMLSGLVLKINDAEVFHEPYDHYYLQDCFPADFYQEMVHNLPPLEYMAPFTHEDSVHEGAITRYRLLLENHEDPGRNGVGNFPSLPKWFRDYWAPIGVTIRSPWLREVVFEKLQQDLTVRFRQGLNAIRKIRTSVEVYLVRDLPGYKIAPHPDYHTKVITAQFYLPKDDTAAHLGTAVYTKEGETFTKVKQFSFSPNCGYAFAVSDKSWHGVEQMGPSEQPRDSLIVVYRLKK